LRIIRIFYGIVRARNGWHIRAARELASGGFRAESFHGFGARTNKGDSRLRASTRKRRIFREKTVARMNGIAAGSARRVNYFLNAEITFARSGGANGIRFVGKANVQRFAVNFAENRNAANAQLAAGTQDAHGDFAAIGNQNFPEHGPLMLLRDFSTRDIAAKRQAHL